jgi:hypothetical protein
MLDDDPPPYPGREAKERSRIQGEIDLENLPPNYSEIDVSPNSSDGIHVKIFNFFTTLYLNFSQRISE